MERHYLIFISLCFGLLLECKAQGQCQHSCIQNGRCIEWEYQNTCLYIFEGKRSSWEENRDFCVGQGLQMTSELWETLSHPIFQRLYHLICSQSSVTGVPTTPIPEAPTGTSSSHSTSERKSPTERSTEHMDEGLQEETTSNTESSTSVYGARDESCNTGTKENNVDMILAIFGVLWVRAGLGMFFLFVFLLVIFLLYKRRRKSPDGTKISQSPYDPKVSSNVKGNGSVHQNGFVRAQESEYNVEKDQPKPATSPKPCIKPKETMDQKPAM